VIAVPENGDRIAFGEHPADGRRAGRRRRGRWSIRGRYKARARVVIEAGISRHLLAIAEVAAGAVQPFVDAILHPHAHDGIVPTAEPAGVEGCPWRDARTSFVR